MPFKKITIIGLGLIGGSLASALKKSNFAATVSGVDTDQDSLDYAVKEGIIDEGSQDIATSSRDTEIIVISTHVGFIREAALSAAAAAQEGAVITDTGSVKESVISEIEAALPECVHFVGGHPIAGTENSGVRYSDPGLFKERRCVLTPTESTDAEALRKVASMWEAVGARVFEMDSQTHDMLFGTVSHLPHVVAYSLMNSVLSSDNQDTLFEFAGGGLKDYTRVASSSPEMWTDIFRANRQNLLQAISRFEESLSKIKAAIENDDESALRKELIKARDIKKNDLL